MLILTRRVGETLMIGDEVTVTVLGKPVLISAANVATIKEAPPLQVEYVK